VATELSITPQINAGDYLTLEIDQKINELKEGQGQSSQPNTTNREAKTTAIVKDGQTIVIGGIMRDRTIVNETKVPFLGDIPILGWLFKSRSKSTDKVNLLLFITPHIIRDTADMDDVFFKKLKEREGFLDQIGMEEKKGIPFSGYSKEQLQFLDEDYVKSIHLRTPKGAESGTTGGDSGGAAPAPTNKTLEPNLQPALPTNLPTIPVAPRANPPEDGLDIGPIDDEINEPKKREEIVIPVAPSIPEISIPAPVDAPIETPAEPSTPNVGPSNPSAPNSNELPPLDELLEDDSDTEGAIESDSELL
jgi:hypothetical protein